MTHTEDKKYKWNLARADGGSRPCTTDRLTSLKAEFEQIASDAGANVNDRRELAHDIRFCRWPGQSRDGKKRADALGGVAPFPFEGASDARIRLADGTINEQVMIIMAAVTRSSLTFAFQGTEADDAELAANLNILWGHVLRSQLSAEWFVELTKVAQWRQGDSPGIAYLQVYWKQEKALQPLTVTSTEFVEKLLTQITEGDLTKVTPELTADMEDLLNNPERLEELAEIAEALWDEMPSTRAAKVAEAWQTEQTATFPYPYVRENRLAVKARRLFDDIFIPENTSDHARGRVVYVREWYTEVELREMDAKGEFKPGFVAEVLKHEGKSGWKHMSHYNESGEFSDSITQRTWDSNRRRGQFELLTAFYWASNTDGIPGLYTVQYHHAVEKAGTDEELFDYKIGTYPFVPFPREITSSSPWDSRGISELSSTEQQSIKLLHDSFMDHAQLCTVPPIMVPANRPKLNLVIGPLKQIKEQRPGEIKFMQMAQYPQSNDKVQQAIMIAHDRYNGRMGRDASPDLVRLYGQHLIDTFFLGLREVIRMGIRLCYQFMPDAQLQRILGKGFEPVSRLIEDIQGGFDADLSFEAGMLQFDYLKEVGNLITAYALAWDNQSQIQRGELISWFMGAISPQLARRVVRPVEEASADEIKDEENNFAKIAAGVEPPMETAGQNFNLRLDVQLGLAEKNPEAIQKLTPVSRSIWEARLKHLQGQVQQEQNAVIGRTMARPALDGGGA